MAHVPRRVFRLQAWLSGLGALALWWRFAPEAPSAGFSVFLVPSHPAQAPVHGGAIPSVPLTGPSSGSHPQSNRLPIVETAGTAVTLLSIAAGLRRRIPQKATGAETSPAPVSAGTPWRGAKAKPFAICVAIGLFVKYILPMPAAVTPQAWSMLAIFVSTIAGVILAPMPGPAVAMVALAFSLVTGTITFAQGVKTFGDEVLWLVLIAFFFAKAISNTGLGNRIAYNIIRIFGKTPLGLSYGLNFAESLLGSGMPCACARGAGVMYPLVSSVSKASGSDPDKGTEDKLGRFLVQAQFQQTGITSCIWLTGAAQNFLCLKLAADLGYKTPSPFKTWFLAGIVPGLLAKMLMPLLVFFFLPPTVKSTPEAPAQATRKLEEMGPITRDQYVTGIVMLCMVGLWAGADIVGLTPAVTAFAGFAVLLCTGALTWGECVAEKGAWSTFISFSVLVSLSSMLNQLGLVKYFATTISGMIAKAGLSTGPAFFLLLSIYVVSHYMFASTQAHLGALFQPFIVMMVQTGTPPLAATLALAYATNLFASLTNYTCAEAPIVYAGGFVKQGPWYKMGLIAQVFHFGLWGVVGGVWWKILGII